MRIVFILILLEWNTSLVGQSRVAGLVTDSLNTPVPFAVVSLQAAGTLITSATQTDSSGHFSLDYLASNDYQITITHVGFETYESRFKLRKDTSFSIKLLHSTIQLSTV